MLEKYIKRICDPDFCDGHRPLSVPFLLRTSGKVILTDKLARLDRQEEEELRILVCSWDALGGRGLVYPASLSSYLTL